MTYVVEAPAGFAELGIDERFLRALSAAEIVTPTEIQVAMIPPVLEGRDVIGQARTGTGKTIAFALPLLQRLDPHAGLQALCLVPTRELAMQVVEEIRLMTRKTTLRAVAVLGGQRMRGQVAALEKKPQFVVATPGRLLDLMGRRLLDPRGLKAVVLDEVDRMLDIGFRDDIRRILRQLPKPHQTLVVSATIDDEIRKLVGQHTHDAVWLDVSRDQLTVAEIDEYYVTVDSHDKLQMLDCVLRQERPELAIIFTNTKGMARRLAERLREKGHHCAEIHGDLRQQKRQAVMERFRRQDIHLLVATDLAARGIDVDGITHIINYDIPVDPEIHIHRIGRTGRMGATGKAITFVSRDEGKQLTAVEMLTNRLIRQQEVEGFRPTPAPLRRRRR
jgi:ATP-dependent RNA helicase DeaD